MLPTLFAMGMFDIPLFTLHGLCFVPDTMHIHPYTSLAPGAE